MERLAERIKVDCIGHMAAGDSSPEECGMGVLVLHVPVGVVRRVVRSMQDRPEEEYETDGTVVYGRTNVRVTIEEIPPDEPNEPDVADH